MSIGFIGNEGGCLIFQQNVGMHLIISNKQKKIGFSTNLSTDYVYIKISKSHRGLNLLINEHDVTGDAKKNHTFFGQYALLICRIFGLLLHGY